MGGRSKDLQERWPGRRTLRGTTRLSAFTLSHEGICTAPGACTAILTLRFATWCGDATDVVRAGLRAQEREEQGEFWQEWQRARPGLPPEPLAAEVERAIERRIRIARLAERRKPRR